MSKKIYNNIGESINEISNVDDVKEYLGILMTGDALPMPFISKRTPFGEIRMNRKFAGDMNNLLSAGSYRVGTSATNSPADGSLGWCDVSAYIEGGSGLQSAMQRYTATDGSQKVRLYEAGTWTSWT